MGYIQCGDLVRIYYDIDEFDEGEVTSIDQETVTVDFYDWIERFPENVFTIRDLFYEGVEVLMPVQRGKVVVDFRRS